MAITTQESAATLPARQVFIKTKKSEQALRAGLTMPAYTIQRDAPWMESTHSEDDLGDLVSDAPALSSKASYHPSYHAHPQQQIADNGPQVRSSKLPIFKQVRSMLQKPPPLVAPGQVKWDDYSGEMSESGKPAQVKPSTRPYEGMFKVRRSSPERPRKSKRDLSPVSILRDDDIKPPPPLKAGRCSPSIHSYVSPVSPISSHFTTKPPTPLSANERSHAVPATTTAPTIKQLRRKPAPSTSPSQTENLEPYQRSPSARSDWTDVPDEDFSDPQRLQPNKSHFSWSTHAPSMAPGRPSVDSRASSKLTDGQQPRSRFSWSTVNTNMGHQVRPDSPPPSPVPPIPSQYAENQQPPPYTTTHGAPVQSVLSRGRPVQRQEKEDWSPTPRKASAPVSAGGTPVSANGVQHPAFRTQSPASTTPTTVTTASGKKALPLPPELRTPTPTVSHLETLRARERDIQLQKRNVLKSIAELEKIEKAGPLQVSFSELREAKKKMEEQRRRLDEVQAEEMEVGIAISRARRKEGEEEGLWVRRVTG
jgi:hypothetical protein